MIDAVRSTDAKKPAEAASKPAPQPKTAEARVADKPESPAPAPKPAADQTEVSPEATSEEGQDEDAMMERVRRRVEEGRTETAEGGFVDPRRVGIDEDGSGLGAAGGSSIEHAGEEAAEPPPTPEEQALGNLDQYGNLYDNPGDSDNPDGKISQDDIDAIARGEYDHDSAREYLMSRGVAEDEIDETLQSIEDSANYLQDHDDLRNQLDTGNDQDGGPDGTISRGDISRVLFDRQQEQAERGQLEPGESASNRDSYPEVDTVDERTPEIIEQQEASVLDAVTSGQPVEFTNSNGETEMLSITQLDSSGDNAVYEITGEDGNKIRITSELGASDNRVALARVADYYSQLPPGVRDSVSEIELLQHADDFAAADYQSGNDHIRFYDGLVNLNEEVFNHEYGHGIGYTESDKDGGFLGIFGGTPEGAPEGWQDAIQGDKANPSDYAGTSYVEDFAESWSAYLEAREQGPEALQRLMEAYPNRYEILDQIYENAAA